MNNYAQVMNKSWKSHNKSLTGYVQFINKSILLCHEQAMRQPCASHEHVKNKWWTINGKVMKKLGLLHEHSWTSHEQVVRKSWTDSEQVMNSSWKIHKQVIDKSRSNYEQLLKKSITSHEQVIASHEQIMISSWTSHEELLNKLKLLFRVDVCWVKVGSPQFW